MNELISLLTEKEDSLKIEYKEVVEFTCKEIPKSIKSKIIDYINKTIESVVLENDEQKQFLVSQLMENSISTYNHIQQIVTLIETCNINGSDALNYVTLYKFLHENEEIVEAFEKSSSVATLGNTISIYQIFREWFTVNKEDGEQVAPEA